MKSLGPHTCTSLNGHPTRHELRYELFRLEPRQGHHTHCTVRQGVIVPIPFYELRDWHPAVPVQMEFDYGN